MTKKNLWLYKITKYKLFYDDIKETEFWNFNVYRNLSKYKLAYNIHYICKYLLIKGYKIKQLSKQKISKYDCWDNEKSAAAWSERKSWKRNSKRKHQWK